MWAKKGPRRSSVPQFGQINKNALSSLKIEGLNRIIKASGMIIRSVRLGVIGVGVLLRRASCLATIPSETKSGSGINLSVGQSLAPWQVKELGARRNELLREIIPRRWSGLKIVLEDVRRLSSPCAKDSYGFNVANVDSTLRRSYDLAMPLGSPR